jgi:photosystem II stability/assembly factor-like uncharacterized protein
MVLEESRPETDVVVHPWDRSWWRYPLERNSDRRIDVAPGAVRSVALAPGSHAVWVGGTLGVLQSAGGIAGWSRAPVRAATAAVPAGVARLALAPSPPTPVEPVLQVVRFSRRGAAWGVSDRGELFTRDAGGALLRVSTPLDGRVEDVYLSPGRAWVLGGGRAAARQEDGRWTLAALVGVRALAFADADRGWAVGDSGQVWTTSDAGRAWTPQSRVTARTLRAVAVLGSAGAVVVGDSGVVLRTANGGRDWRGALAARGADLLAVWMADVRTGYAAGAHGAVLATHDGGMRWSAQRWGGTDRLRTLTFASPQEGWAGGDRGVVYTHNGGRTWRRVLGPDRAVVSMAMTLRGTGYALLAGGTVLKTGNSGRSWRRIRGTVPGAEALTFVSADTGWAVGREGLVFATHDGGLHWLPQVSGVKADLRAVQFISPARGWAVGAGGTVLATTNGGRSWRLQRTGTTRGVRGLHFMDDSTGWAVGDSALVLRTRDAGRTWTQESLPALHGSAATLTSVHFSEPERGWIVGDSARVLASADSGTNWTTVRTDIAPGTRLHAVRFATAAAGVIGGDGGTLLQTVDGGYTWVRNSAAGPANVRVVLAAPPTRLWAGGDRGLVLDAPDGQAWRERRGYVRMPPPWYGFALLGFVLLLVPGLVREPRGAGGEARFVDRPLRAGDPDPVGLRNLASALSRFLRNAETHAPLAIAVTGAWGSGKSSLMNLLREDLVKCRFRPIMFNAWHHEKEESLLASLLENVRLEVVPPMYTASGLAFRARLVYRRVKRRWPLALALLAAFSVGAGYFAVDFPDRLWHVVEPLYVIVVEHRAPSLEWTALASFVAVLTPLVGFWKSLRAFGLDPARLVPRTAGQFKPSELRAQAGFRHRFAAEFSDVTWALKPYEMVLMVDDLDRCRPESIRTILDTINFLVSSGQCYILLGMDRKLVQGYLAASLASTAYVPPAQRNSAVAPEPAAAGDAARAPDAATASTAAEPAPAPPRRNRAAALAQARKYLEKLIQLEVQIPRPTPEQLQRLMEHPRRTQASWSRRFWCRARVLRPLLLGVVVVAAVVAVSVRAGLGWSGGLDPSAAEAFPDNVSLVALSTRLASAGGVALPSPDAAPRALAEQATSASLDLSGGPAGWLVAAGLSVLAVLVMVRTFQQTVVLYDSDVVNESMKAWNPVVARGNPTPRRVKQFSNRVRYYLARQEQGSAASPPMQCRIPEAAVVGLTVLETFWPAWLRDPEQLRTPERTLEGIRLDDDDHTDARIKLELSHAILGGNLYAYVRDFQALSAEVVISGPRTHRQGDT